MQAEIIAIGDEILIGQTIDTNSAFIASQLNLYGIKVHMKRVIADEAEAIRLALDTVHPKTKYVFMTGGLGPTKDDITKKTLLDYFGGEMVYKEEVYTKIVELFNSFKREPKEVHRQQAYVPSSCEAIVNDTGTAPGMRFEKDGRYFFSTPGVPYETEHLVGDKIVPWILKNQELGTIYHKTIITQGIGESDLAEKLSDWENNLPSELKLAYLPSPGLVKLRLSGHAGSQEESKKMVLASLEEARQILGDLIFGEDANSIEEIVGQALRAKGASLAVAESCTGGYVGHLLTKVPGSSDYFLGGILSYSNELKMKLLGVQETSLKDYGAVSEAVALQMAEGVRQRCGSDYGIATTGVAGPSGGSPEKPVGTVWIAVSGPRGSEAKKYNFGNHRERNIRRTALMALDRLRKEVQKIEY